MSFMYKSGQGYWTRLMSAISGGILVASCALWLSDQLELVDVSFERIYLQGGAAAAVMVIGLAIVLWLVYLKPRSSEFLIATEGEMKKVNWSTRREIMGSTWVVIAISVIIAVILFVTDSVFATFFRSIGVLKT